MITVGPNVAGSPAPSNAEETTPSARCHHCGKPPHHTTRRKDPDCGLVQLKVSYKAAIRIKLRKLVYDSQLPKEEVARCVLGVDPSTMWSYLNGGVIPASKASQIHGIAEVYRDGNYIHTITRCPDRPRWRHMLYTRDRAMECQP